MKKGVLPCLVWSLVGFLMAAVVVIITESWTQFKFSNSLTPVIDAKENQETQKNVKASTTKRGVSNRRRFMTLDFKGRLGNLMFQYSALISIAKKNNITPLIPVKFSLNDMFHISAQKASRIGEIKFEEKKSVAYDPRTDHMEGISNIHLKGYFQSFKYFKKYEQQLRKEFTFKDKVLSSARSKFHELVSNFNSKGETTFIALHVRRGDMIRDKVFIDFGYVSPGMDYINKAMNTFRSKHPNCLFIVASDDIGWCKQNIKTKDVRFLKPGQSAVLDMAILTQCNHTVVTVGSYGWWIAWLVNGETIYWKDFPRPNSKLAAETVNQDYWPSHWVAM